MSAGQHLFVLGVCKFIYPYMDNILRANTLLSLLHAHTGPGAILFIDVANSEVPNNTMIIPGNFSSSEVGKGLSCCSSSDANLIGQWFFPNGEVVPDNVFGAVFFTQQRISRVTLFEGGGDFTEDTEGVYTCRIPDDTGVEQILFAGIYQTETYENSGKYTAPQLVP